MNFIHGRITAVEDQRVSIELADGNTTQLRVTPAKAKTGDAVTLGIRPEHFREDSEGEVKLRGTVDVVERLGDVSYIYLHLADGADLIVCAPGSSRVHHGHAITISADAGAVHLFDAAGQAFERLDDDPRYRLEPELLKASGADL